MPSNPVAGGSSRPRCELGSAEVDREGGSSQTEADFHAAPPCVTKRVRADQQHPCPPLGADEQRPAPGRTSRER
jgi:hypothetical protein